MVLKDSQQQGRPNKEMDEQTQKHALSFSMVAMKSSQKYANQHFL
jgi:hypothetical protein